LRDEIAERGMRDRDRQRKAQVRRHLPWTREATRADDGDDVSAIQNGTPIISSRKRDGSPGQKTWSAIPTYVPVTRSPNQTEPDGGDAPGKRHARQIAIEFVLVRLDDPRGRFCRRRLCFGGKRPRGAKGQNEFALQCARRRP